jgi:hypothetical protein
VKDTARRPGFAAGPDHIFWHAPTWHYCFNMSTSLESAFAQYIDSLQRSIARVQSGTQPRREVSASAIIAVSEATAEFRRLVLASDEEYKARMEPLSVQDATKHELMAFLRLSGSYRDALARKPLTATAVVSAYRAAMEAQEHSFTYLALMEGVEFSSDFIDCGGFEIRKFPPGELAEFVGNPTRRLFFDGRHHIDVDVFENYWFIVITGKAPILRWYDAQVFDRRIQVTYSSFQTPVESALRRLALFDWHRGELFQEPGFTHKPRESYGTSFPDFPFVLSLSDSLVAWPCSNPQADLHGQEFDEDGYPVWGGAWLTLDEPETERFAEFIRQSGDLVTKAEALGADGAFLSVAMGFLLKACGATGMEQLLWNIAAIEGAVGDEPVTATLQRRVSRIFGATDADRAKFKKAFRDLYNFRSGLVHANSVLPKQEIYAGHLRQARIFARGVVWWMLNYVDLASKLVTHGGDKKNLRQAVLKFIDLELAVSDVSGLSRNLEAASSRFPFVADWLT